MGCRLLGLLGHCGAPVLTEQLVPLEGQNGRSTVSR